MSPSPCRPASPLPRAPRTPRLSLQTEEPTGLLSRFRPPPPPPEPEPPSGGNLAAAGGLLASSAIIAEGVQIAGTAVLFYFAQQWTGTSSPVEAVSYMIDFLQQAGPAGYGYFATAMIVLQVIPVAAAFVLTVSAGAEIEKKAVTRFRYELVRLLNLAFYCYTLMLQGKKPSMVPSSLRFGNEGEVLASVESPAVYVCKLISNLLEQQRSS